MNRLRLEHLRSALVGPFELAVPPGGCVAITGASGSGKSLFLRLVADLDPGEGQVWLDGQERGAMTAPEWRRQVAYAPAESGWWADAVAAHFTDLPAARALTERFGLKPDLLDGPVLRLSTGERQRLALARTLLGDPRVLLLDEPTGALDGAAERMVETVLRERMAAGVAVLLATHDPEQGDRLGARAMRMQGGRLQDRRPGDAAA